MVKRVAFSRQGRSRALRTRWGFKNEKTFRNYALPCLLVELSNPFPILVYAETDLRNGLDKSSFVVTSLESSSSGELKLTFSCYHNLEPNESCYNFSLLGVLKLV